MYKIYKSASNDVTYFMLCHNDIIIYSFYKLKRAGNISEICKMEFKSNIQTYLPCAYNTKCIYETTHFTEAMDYIIQMRVLESV